jgi:uncharacterized membrane protein
METVLQYEIPVLHPLAVHFPVALLVSAALFSAVWLVRGRSLGRRIASVLMVLGSAGAVLAYMTGESIEELSEDIPIVEEMIGLHQDLALATVWISILMSVCVCYLEWRRRSADAGSIDPLPLRTALFSGFFLLALIVLFTGHVGGIMVWGVAR